MARQHREHADDAHRRRGDRASVSQRRPARGLPRVTDPDRAPHRDQHGRPRRAARRPGRASRAARRARPRAPAIAGDRDQRAASSRAITNSGTSASAGARPAASRPCRARTRHRPRCRATPPASGASARHRVQRERRTATRRRPCRRRRAETTDDQRTECPWRVSTRRRRRDRSIATSGLQAAAAAIRNAIRPPVRRADRGVGRIVRTSGGRRTGSCAARCSSVGVVEVHVLASASCSVIRQLGSMRLDVLEVVLVAADDRAAPRRTCSSRRRSARPAELNRLNTSDERLERRGACPAGGRTTRWTSTLRRHRRARDRATRQQVRLAVAVDRVRGRARCARCPTARGGSAPAVTRPAFLRSNW